MQTTDTVLMVEPVAFDFNIQTAENNFFQVKGQDSDVQKKALEEYLTFVEKLRAKGINVISVKDTLDPHTPDSIFPNNWVSFHSDGTVVLYPMFAENRRLERRQDILDELESFGFEIKKIIDLSNFENQGMFLEGTGSMIFDHDNKIAYGSVSIRLNENLFLDFCKNIGYQSVVFHSFQNVGGKRLPIYHTNVMMAVADRYVVICLDAIDNVQERELVIKTILESGKEIIEITEEQMHNFAGNMLQVQNVSGEKFLVMSQRAFESLTQKQIEQIENYNSIIHTDLKTIEDNGGGSARCMLAEIFL